MDIKIKKCNGANGENVYTIYVGDVYLGQVYQYKKKHVFLPTSQATTITQKQINDISQFMYMKNHKE